MAAPTAAQGEEMSSSSDRPQHGEPPASEPDAARLTTLLRAAAGGDSAAFDEVASRVYGELERLAAARLRGDFGAGWRDVTLEPRALVNETFLRLLDRPSPDGGFENRRHFFAFAGRVMSRVLLDYHRSHGAAKRGAGRVRVTLSGIATPATEPGVEIPALTATLDKLDRADSRKGEVARLRLLWGCTVPEIAEMLGVSVPTVERDWRFVRVWIAEELGL
jgi:RNA polymerase sigma factor (TIGR02999 family)